VCATVGANLNLHPYAIPHALDMCKSTRTTSLLSPQLFPLKFTTLVPVQYQLSTPSQSHLFMGLHIVLIEPEIPMNTGNIGRLSLGSGSTLHLVKPFGFELTDQRLKRAGLDYWKHISLCIYDSIDDFFTQHKGKRFAFLSSHGTTPYSAIDYTEDMFLVFGKESTGLPETLRAQHTSAVFTIPLYSEHIRSLNLANAVSIVVYEGIRQLQLKRANLTS